MARSKQKFTMARYRINSDWAESLDGATVLSRNGNYRPTNERTETLGYFEYQSLGGLVVYCSQQTITPEVLSRAADHRRQRIIDLSADQEVRFTSTRLLAAAFLVSVERDPDSDLASPSFEGPFRKLLLDDNDTWAIPVSATTRVRSELYSMHLPHQLVESPGIPT